MALIRSSVAVLVALFLARAASRPTCTELLGAMCADAPDCTACTGGERVTFHFSSCTVDEALAFCARQPAMAGGARGATGAATEVLAAVRGGGGGYVPLTAPCANATAVSGALPTTSVADCEHKCDAQARLVPSSRECSLNVV